MQRRRWRLRVEVTALSQDPDPDPDPVCLTPRPAQSRHFVPASQAPRTTAGVLGTVLVGSLPPGNKLLFLP